MRRGRKYSRRTSSTMRPDRQCEDNEEWCETGFSGVKWSGGTVMKSCEKKKNRSPNSKNVKNLILIFDGVGLPTGWTIEIYKSILLFPKLWTVDNFLLLFHSVKERKYNDERWKSGSNSTNETYTDSVLSQRIQRQPQTERQKIWL